MTEEQMKQTWCSRSLTLIYITANPKIYGVVNRDINPDGSINIDNHKCLGSLCPAFQKMMVFDPVSKTQVQTVYCAEMPQRPMMP